MKTNDWTRKNILEELKRIDILLFYWVQKSRLQRQMQKMDEFRGLYISEEEIDRLIAPQEELEGATDASLESIEEAIRRKTEEIEQWRAKSENKGQSFPLDRLTQTFGLDGFDREALLFSVAPELHLKYERIYAYLQDNVTKKKPTVDLLLTLLCPNREEKIAHRFRFLYNAPLIANHILELYDEPGVPHSPLLAKWVKVDERIVNFLLGEDVIDQRIAPFVELVHPQARIDSLWVSSELKDQLFHWGRILGEKKPDQGLLFHFSGPAGVGKRLAAEAIAHKAGLNLLVINLQSLVSSDVDLGAIIGFILRESRLRDAISYWDSVDVLFKTRGKTEEWGNILFDKIRSSRGVNIFGGLASPDTNSFFFQRLPAIQIEFPPPSYDMRKQLWEENLSGKVAALDPGDLANLANRFRLTGGQIQKIVSTAQLNGHPNRSISPDHLFELCRSYSRHRLANLAVKITPRRSWDDIVLPKDQMEVLHEICHYVTHQPIVLDCWGFGKKLVQNKGLNVLFAGPSGTGKTMAAEILAGELGLDLYRIDLATVVSKYIGETEKNLDRIFREAEHSNAILFFDEADAIFGKRSEVRDSHDRYANIEVSYLLQKMEAYDGIAILATNLRKNLDQAFLRRMHFTVEFPLPEEEDRLKIWRLCFPPAAPLAEDVDLQFLAKKFKISGGNIKNIAVASAFLAAENGGKINMASLIRATKREFQKMGKLIVESDFGLYSPLLVSPAEEVKG